MWDIKTILKDFLEIKDFQEFINRRFKSESSVIVPKNIIKYVETDYAKFYLDDMFSTIGGANSDYSLEGLRSDDIVLDIGACIGAFSLKIAKKVSHIFAVEPMMTERLRQNININNIT